MVNLTAQLMLTFSDLEGLIQGHLYRLKVTVYHLFSMLHTPIIILGAITSLSFTNVIPVRISI